MRFWGRSQASDLGFVIEIGAIRDLLITLPGGRAPG